MTHLTDEGIRATLPAKQLRILRERNPHNKHLIFDGMLVGAPQGYDFNPNFPHTYCRICGAVYQTPLERTPDPLPAEQIQSVVNRRKWSFTHSATHSLTTHTALIVSGRYMTPEATLKLVPLGIIPLTDMIFSNEVEQAAGEAPRLDAATQDEMEAQQ